MTEPAAPPVVPAAPDLAAPPAPPVASMPDGLPPLYWDGQANAVKTDDVVKDFIGLHKFKSEHDARIASVPEKPEGYKLELPTEFAVPQGMKITFDEKDPRVTAARTFAKENNLDQTSFSKMLAFDAQQKVAEFNAALAQIDAEQAKLGDKFPARKSAVDAFLNAHLPKDKAAAMTPFVTNAAAFEALELLIAKANGSAIPGAPSGDPPTPPQQTMAERWYGGSQQKAS